MIRASAIRAATVFAAACLTFANRGSAATYVVPPDEVLVGKANAIVVARALHSYVEDSKDRGIETVTVFAVEERLKGDAALDSLEVRIPGGMIESEDGRKRFKVVPGAPHFVDGERVLLFVTKSKSGYYSTTDFGLGVFKFATDDLGHRVLIRNETEIHGWDRDGSVHREPRRDAARLLQFVRDVVNGRPVQNNYTIEPRPLVGEKPAETTRSRLRPVTEACSGCTVTQYTLANTENDPGFRWKTFENWNRGNAATNAPNNGSDAINIAFSSWATNSAVAYTLASTNADPDGILDMDDGVNNIVFEDDLSAFGTYSCASGGLLGIGGINLAFTDVTNVVNGEQFFRTDEGDVSMNFGVNICIPASLSVANFNTAITHEVGHTLGFRHTNTARASSTPCTNFPAYDCETTAIMTASLVPGLNGVLAAWDQRAVSALYPGSGMLPAPTGVVATPTAATTIAISWNAVMGASTYQVHRSASNNFNNFTIVPACSGAATACSDTTAVSGAAYLYKVRAGSTGTFSATDLATAIIFTDPTLIVGTTTVKVVHITQLRTAVNAVQTLAMQTPTAYTDNTLTTAIVIKAAHITELRSRLATARATLGQSTITFTDGTITPSVTLIKAAHINDLRNGVR